MDERRTLLYDQYSSIQTAEADEIQADNADTDKRQVGTHNLDISMQAYPLKQMGRGVLVSISVKMALSIIASPHTNHI